MRSKCGSCLQKVSVSLAEICTYLTAIYGMEATEGENEDPITLKSGDLDLINWMQRMFRDSMILWASNPLKSEQVSGTPKLSFSEALLKVSPEHREEMKILDLRIPTHLLPDSNTDSSDESEESSIEVEGHYTLDMDDDNLDGSTANPDGHESQNNSVALNMQIKNLCVSEINNNFPAMETDSQELATTASATLPTKEPRPVTSNHVPPVDKLDEDLLDFEEDSGSEEQKERKKKKARRGSGKAKREAKKKEQEERKRKEEQQQHSPEKLVTISSEEYQFLKQQGNLVLSLAERLKK